MSREDVELQILEHLRALRQEVAALHEKIDAVAAARAAEADVPDDAED